MKRTVKKSGRYRDVFKKLNDAMIGAHYQPWAETDKNFILRIAKAEGHNPKDLLIKHPVFPGLPFKHKTGYFKIL